MHKVFILILVLFVPYLAAEKGEITGEWEGQLLSPRRPIVMYVNFDKKTARLDAAGSQELPLDVLNRAGTGIQFMIALRDQKLEFSGTRIGGQISGTLTGEKPIYFSMDRLPEFADPRNRVEAWRQDLKVVLDRFLKYDRSYSDQQRKEAIRILQDLDSSLPLRTDQQVIVGLSRAIAQTDNAHTRLYLLRNRTELRRYPIRVWWFSDGLHVVKGTPDYQELLGCKVLKIGKYDPSIVREKVAELFAGNESWINYKSVYYMTSPEVLRGLDLIEDMEKAEWTFQCRNQSKQKAFIALALERKTEPTEAWWDLTPQWKADQRPWIHSLSGNIEHLPLYLRNPEQHYWFEVITSQKALYFQYNRSQNKQGAETLQQFGERLLKTLHENEVKTLIVDLRFNTGGNLDIAQNLMETLKKEAAERQVRPYVLMGRSTFSAGISHAAQWKEGSNSATFVGEPCGDQLDTFSEGGNLILPNSKLTVHYANGFHSYSKIDYPHYQPYYMDLNIDHLNLDIPVQQSAASYFSGKDPVLDAVFTAD